MLFGLSDSVQTLESTSQEYGCAHDDLFLVREVACDCAGDMTLLQHM